jgi:hypothetical protein
LTPIGDPDGCRECIDDFADLGEKLFEYVNAAEKCETVAGSVVETCMGGLDALAILAYEVALPLCSLLSTASYVVCVGSTPFDTASLGSTLCGTSGICCPNCTASETCDPQSATCVCADGFYGVPPDCSKDGGVCPLGKQPCDALEYHPMCCDAADVCFEGAGCCPPGSVDVCVLGDGEVVTCVPPGPRGPCCGGFVAPEGFVCCGAVEPCGLYEVYLVCPPGNCAIGRELICNSALPSTGCTYTVPGEAPLLGR